MIKRKILNLLMLEWRIHGEFNAWMEKISKDKLDAYVYKIPWTLYREIILFSDSKKS